MGPGEFLDKVMANDIAAVRQALASDPSLAGARDPHLGSTPLIFAAHRGFTEVVAAVLDAGGDVHAREAASDTTPLHWAAEGGHRAIARLLLDRGADLEAIDGWFRLTPLGWATVVTWNPSFHEDKPATAADLLQKGARVDVFTAMAIGKADAVRALAAADPGALERRLGFVADEKTPLHFAVGVGLHEMVRLLLDLGADPSVRTSAGLTALAIALWRKDLEAATLLAARGAAEDLSSAMVSGNFAAMEARLSGSAGGVPEEQAGQLLFFAAEGGMAEAARILLAHGADPNRRAKRLIGETPGQVVPLHLAAKGGHVTAARALLERGAMSEPPGTEDGTPTPLHLAAGEGRFDMVRFLLEAGADASARDKAFGATPLGWAEHGGHAEVSELLRASSKVRPGPNRTSA